MKSLFRITSLLPLFFIFALPVSAELPSPTSASRQDQNRDRQQARQEIRQELRPTITQEKLTLRRQNTLKITNNMLSKLEKRLAYLNKIKELLQTRINNLKTTRNLTEAQAKLNQYSTTKFDTDLAALKVKIAEINIAEKPSSLIPGLRSSAKLVQDDLKDLHQLLVDVLKSIVKAPKISS